MALLCKAHLDKSFVAGAEQMAAWQELAASAAAKGKKNPLPSEPSVFQIIKAGENDVYVYLPEEYAHEAYFLGTRYQRAEIPAPEAIDKMQALADQLCLYELRLSEPFQVLQFLRDELDPSSVDSSTAGLS